MQQNFSEHNQQAQWQKIKLQSQILKNMAINENWENFLNASNKYAKSLEKFFKAHGKQASLNADFAKEVQQLIQTDQSIQSILKTKNQDIAKELIDIQKRKFAENAYHYIQTTPH